MECQRGLEPDRTGKEWNAIVAQSQTGLAGHQCGTAPEAWTQDRQCVEHNRPVPTNQIHPDSNDSNEHVTFLAWPKSLSLIAWHFRIFFGERNLQLFPCLERDASLCQPDVEFRPKYCTFSHGSGAVVVSGRVDSRGRCYTTFQRDQTQEITRQY